MQNMIVDFIDHFGYLGVFLLITLENVFPPIPSEVVLTFSGFMTLHSSMTLPGVVVVATLGSVAGAIILYAVGRLLSIERLQRLIDGRVGQLLHFKRSDLTKTEQWFTKRGKSTLFFCRFIPIVRSLISIPAGTTKMPFGQFLGLTAAGTLIWNIVLVALGHYAGKAWTQVAGYVDSFAKIILIILVILIVVGSAYFVKKRFGSKNS
ncbi:DedA family protein [Loigolactobacillus zhaoyuanensis]|uniref:DedA family protein n=1 Tax=Loigolactobacillus zhaoyuanensis TaxID=2486017 RepID=UPI000F7365BA|nr:DedA family protein [Loigolactobacillus zhaoyuanensis]